MRRFHYPFKTSSIEPFGDEKNSVASLMFDTSVSLVKIGQESKPNSTERCSQESHKMINVFSPPLYHLTVLIFLIHKTVSQLSISCIYSGKKKKIHYAGTGSICS